MARDTENIILEVARKQFVQKGFAAARMQEIAEEANINKALLHYYFRSKENLYLEIIRKTLDMIIPRFAQAMETPGTFWERLEKVVEMYTNTLIQQPDIPIFMLSELTQKRERFVSELNKRASYFPAIQSFLIQMTTEMEEGKIRKVQPVHLLLNILGMTVFPFVAKPVFCTILDVSETDFEALMKERKTVIIDFVKNALRVD